jgi:hypothetical protein
MINRPILYLAIAVLAIALGAIYFLQVKPQPAPATPAPTAANTPAPIDRSPSGQATPRSTAKTTTEKPKKAAATPAPLADWEVKIDQALRANVGESETAQLLINLLPTLPAEGQAEAAQHISNLLLDEDYNRVLPLVKNPNMPEEVLDVFVTDLMNRDDKVKLPTLFDIAKIPNHPHHEEALTDLQIFLDEDYGNDWAKWDAAMKKYLAEQAAEEKQQ